MAAPNIVNVTTITGKTITVTPSATTATLAIGNAAASGKVFKINSILAANTDAAITVNTSVGTNTVADGSGISSSIATAIPVPSGASLIIVDKSTAFYLEENKSIVVTSSLANKMTFTISYEEIS